MEALKISIVSDAIRTKVLRNLQVIGKRAKGGDGSSLFSAVTYSLNESPVFDDMIMFGAENLVSELSDVASSYITNEDTGDIVIVLSSGRWKFDVSDKDESFDLTSALDGMFRTYLYNFCLSRFLDMSFPDNRYSVSYTEHCALIVRNIKTLAFLKRPEGSASKSYGDVVMRVRDDEGNENENNENENINH